MQNFSPAILHIFIVYGQNIVNVTDNEVHTVYEGHVDAYISHIEVETIFHKSGKFGFDIFKRVWYSKFFSKTMFINFLLFKSKLMLSIIFATSKYL